MQPCEELRKPVPPQVKQQLLFFGSILLGSINVYLEPSERVLQIVVATMLGPQVRRASSHTPPASVWASNMEL